MRLQLHKSIDIQTCELYRPTTLYHSVCILHNTGQDSTESSTDTAMATGTNICFPLMFIRQGHSKLRKIMALFCLLLFAQLNSYSIYVYAVFDHLVEWGMDLLHATELHSDYRRNFMSINNIVVLYRWWLYWNVPAECQELKPVYLHLPSARLCSKVRP